MLADLARKLWIGSAGEYLEVIEPHGFYWLLM
jgi:hypothetical protein